MRRWLISPEIGALIGAVIVWAFFWGNGRTFGEADTTLNWLDVAAPTGIMACAVALLMIGGEFDLSSGVMTGATAILIGLMSTYFTGDGINIGWAIAALVELHRQGLTDADAMAENVLIDRNAGVARWFDFETIHDASRPVAWRQADDVRALLVTCLARTVPEKRAGILQVILEVYADDEVTRLLTASFNSVFRRSLSFHLAQAALSFRSFREVARLLETIRARRRCG